MACATTNHKEDEMSKIGQRVLEIVERTGLPVDEVKDEQLAGNTPDKMVKSL